MMRFSRHAGGAFCLLGGIVSTALAHQSPPQVSSLLPSYDYVVVGGGVGGLTVANRLTEDPDTTVLVIEAGHFDQGEDYIDIPGLCKQASGTKYDWNLTYVANPDAANRRIPIPMGKGVGGGSLINYMQFNHGSKSDYNRWMALVSDNWGWDSMLPNFKKSQHYTPPFEHIEEEWNVTYNLAYHGFHGNVEASYSPFIWPHEEQFIDAMTELDVNIPRDGASGQAYGAFFVTHSQDPATATRHHARKAYYDPAAGRPNLHLLTGNRVTRLITEPSCGSPKVAAVEFAASSDSERTTVDVRKEAIMAAGGIHTPQVLQLSGIGDGPLLDKLGIETVAHVPGIGTNLQDHLFALAVFSFEFPLSLNNLTTNATYAAEMMELYKANRTGPYTTATGDFLGFLPAQKFSPRYASIAQAAREQDPKAYLAKDSPQSFIDGYKKELSLLADGVASDEQAVLEIIWSGGTFVLGLMHPFTRGTVRLASKDPFDAPLADSMFLHNPLDVELMIDAVKYARTITQTDPMQAFNPVEIMPGANVSSDAEIAQAVRENLGTLFHPSCTCRAGKFEDGAVVDEQFRLYGVKNLRVADASVMPMLPASHVQSTVYALGEKAAAAIKQ